MSLPEGLSLLQCVAPEYGATLACTNERGQATVTIPLTSGQQRVFELELTCAGNTVAVREQLVGNQLPSFCPDRHINPDGSFCLGWGADDPRSITGEAAARIWWSSVVRYLRSQIVASKRHVWPGQENDRAHGDAAKDQAIAENSALSLGPAFAANARLGHFKVRSDRRPGHARLELWRADKRLARVSLRTQQLAGAHTRCPCDTPVSEHIKDCGEHASDLATFIIALYRWRKAEREFMHQLASRGSTCCGTLASCGLRDAVVGLQNAPKSSEKPNARRSKYYRPPIKPKRPR